MCAKLIGSHFRGQAKPADCIKYNAEPRSIIVDPDFNFIGLKVLDKDNNKDSFISKSEILNSIGDFKGINFTWTEKVYDNLYEASHIINILKQEDKVKLFTWTWGNKFKDIKIAENFAHPLHEKYGIDNLELIRIEYRSTHIIYERETEITSYIVDKAIFKLKDAQEEIVIAARDLFYYILMKINIHDDEFYKSSCLEYMTIDTNKNVTFEIPETLLNSDSIQNIEFKQATNVITQIQNWKSSMSNLGYEVDCTDTELTEIITHDEENSTRELILPSFLHINVHAFDTLSVREIKLTNPESFIDTWSEFKNEENDIIKVTNEQEESLDTQDHFKNNLSKCFLSFMMRRFRESYNMEEDIREQLIEIDIPLNKE